MDRKTKRILTLALIDLLKEVASYNDKGIAWMKHEPEEIARTRAQYANRLQQMREKLDPGNLTPEAHALFDAPEILTDGSLSHVSRLRGLIGSYTFFIDY